jgi:hypothetical protein
MRLAVCSFVSVFPVSILLSSSAHFWNLDCHATILVPQTSNSTECFFEKSKRRLSSLFLSLELPCCYRPYLFWPVMGVFFISWDLWQGMTFVSVHRQYQCLIMLPRYLALCEVLADYIPQGSRLLYRSCLHCWTYQAVVVQPLDAPSRNHRRREASKAISHVILRYRQHANS